MPAVAPLVFLLGELDGAVDRTAARAFGGRAAGRLTEFGSVLARGSSSHAAAELRSCNAIVERLARRSSRLLSGHDPRRSTCPPTSS